MSKTKTSIKNVKEKSVISVVSLVLSIVSVVIAFWSVNESNMNAKIDRRVEIYTEAIVSLDTICFYEWMLENGNEKIKSEIDEQWLENQLIDAVKIKAKLEILDKKKAQSYWSIVSKMFEKQHEFDSKEYEKLKQDIIDEI